MKITVTPDDIAVGIPGSGDRCPIACALARVLPENETYYVGCFAITIGERAYTTPKVADEFIYRFDDGIPVQPFSFWLDIGDGAEPVILPETKELVPA